MSKPVIRLVGIDPTWKEHPDVKNVWVSHDGKAVKRINENHPERNQWLVYSLASDKDGYKKLTIKGKHTLIHRLVYRMFIGDLEPGLVVCHLDGNVNNNHYTNLCQATQKVNISHKLHHGTHQKGETHPRAIHTQDQISKAKAELKNAQRYLNGKLARGEALRIAELTGVSKFTVIDLSSKGYKVWS